jgi:hypothetical protein
VFIFLSPSIIANLALERSKISQQILENHRWKDHFTKAACDYQFEKVSSRRQQQ